MKLKVVEPLAQPSDYRYAAADGKPNTIWLTAPPCVGSTWVSQVLTELLRWRTVWPATGPVWRKPQDVSVSDKRIDRVVENLFLQHTHTQWNSSTRAFCQAYKPVVVVMHRDILDNIISTVDHLVKVDVGLPNGWISESFGLGTFDEQVQHVTHYCIPWNLNFYISWAHAQQSGIRVIWLDYHDMVSNPIAAIGRILASCQISRTAEEYAHAIAKATPDRTRFNVGKEGRGHSLLSQATKDHVDAMLNACIDPVGKTALERVKPSSYANEKQDALKPNDSRRYVVKPENGKRTTKGTATNNKNRASRRRAAHDSSTANAS